MFRYVGLAWDERRPPSVLRAQALTSRLVKHPQWSTALSRTGLAVFATRTRSRANGAHLLQGNQGVVLGRLFRRNDLQASNDGEVRLTLQEVEEILHSGGRTLVRNFWGRYVAFFRTERGSACVLRDPSGTLPCFLVRDAGVSIVFSWLEDALELLGDTELHAVNWDALKAFIRWGSLGGRETCLTAVSKVLPGEVVDLHHDDSALLWSAVDIARSATTQTGDKAAWTLRDTVRRCALAWASCYDTILFRLSGGVDSSLLLSCVSEEATPADVICVNYHSTGADSDERAYARLAAARAGRDLIERERASGFRIERLANISRTPDPVHYTGRMNASVDASLAAAYGATAIFTGAGGDPLFFEYARWWPAADYLRAKGWDNGFLAAAIDAARLGRVSVWQTMALAISERIRPSHDAFEASGRIGALLAKEFDDGAVGRERFVHPHLLHSGLPIGKRNQTAALMHPLLYYDPFEQASAPESVNPLLSQPLVELCLRLPTYVLTEGGRGRALARRAFAPDLPEQIATRRSKGGMEEHIGQVLRTNVDSARALLLEGQLTLRGLIDRAAVERHLSGTPTAQSSSLSQIHALIAVEAWLTRWTR